jgi:hypothetical protein
MTFKPGQSGNPSGRPKGIEDKRLALRKRLESRSDEILDVAVDRALGGSDSLLAALLSRLIPTVRPETPAVAVSCVTEEVLEGRVSPTAGKEILEVLTLQSKLSVMEDLERRVSELEKK